MKTLRNNHSEVGEEANFADHSWLTTMAMEKAMTINTGEDARDFLHQTLVSLSNFLLTNAHPHRCAAWVWDPRQPEGHFDHWPQLVLLMAELLAGATSIASRLMPRPANIAADIATASPIP